jgi:hypothetical protein
LSYSIKLQSCSSDSLFLFADKKWHEQKSLSAKQVNESDELDKQGEALAIALYDTMPKKTIDACTKKLNELTLQNEFNKLTKMMVEEDRKKLVPYQIGGDE